MFGLNHLALVGVCVNRIGMFQKMSAGMAHIHPRLGVAEARIAFAPPHDVRVPSADNAREALRTLEHGGFLAE